MQQEQNTLKMSEAAKVLGVSTTYVYHLAKRDGIKLASKGIRGCKGHQATLTVSSVRKMAKARGVEFTEATLASETVTPVFSTELEAVLENEVARRVDGAVNKRMTAFMSQIQNIQW